MSEAHSKASKKRMAKYTKEQLSQMGRDLVAKRWETKTAKEMSKYGQMMNKARQAKLKKEEE